MCAKTVADVLTTVLIARTFWLYFAAKIGSLMFDSFVHLYSMFSSGFAAPNGPVFV
jgi:hypothetical protein